jgi:NAD(P)-dependent dehydrogenase (short-subunit alcohol dehydrogenase family)
MQGKIVMVTGASSGIGKATAKQLAALGATVILVARDPAQGQVVLDEITKAGQSAELRRVDLASQASIRQFAADFQHDHKQLHVLINNAGVMRTDFTKTVDGYEMTFAVNQLAPFLLTHLLLDTLKASAPARVINLMGNSGAINFDDLMGAKHYDMMKAYQQSKSANRLFTAELARRLAGTGVTVNGADPGFVATNLGRDARGSFKDFLDSARPSMRTPEQGAASSVYAASAPELESTTGNVIVDKRQSSASQGAKDETDAKRLWDACAQLTGVHA